MILCVLGCLNWRFQRFLQINVTTLKGSIARASFVWNYVNLNRVTLFKSNVLKAMATAIWHLGRKPGREFTPIDLLSYVTVLCNLSPESMSHEVYCSLTACVGREKAINKGKNLMFGHNPAGSEGICGGWECAMLCRESTDSLESKLWVCSAAWGMLGLWVSGYFYFPWWIAAPWDFSVQKQKT